MTKLHEIFTRFLTWWKKLPSAAQARWIFAGISLFFLILLIVNPKPWNLHWPDPETARTRDFSKYYSWFGALIALLGSLFLGLISPWWTKQLPPLATKPKLSEKSPRWFWPLIGIAMFLTAFQGYQRLDFSVWDDEHYTLRRFVQGEFKPDNSDQIDSPVSFRTVKWESTLHGYKLPNNHILYSILARFNFNVWNTLGLTSPEKPYSEFSLRFPAYLFGILALPALALLLKEFGFPRAAVITTWLLAVHPWHIRYASEARGYSLVLCLFPLLLIFWMYALRHSRWKHWAAFALIEFALLYAYPGLLFTVATINILALATILFSRSLKDTRSIVFSRWFFVNAVAGLFFIWFYLPCVPQMLAYLEQTRGSLPLGTWWLQNFFSFLFSGVAWFKSKDLTSVQPELYALMTAHPWIFTSLVYSALTLIGLGALRLLSRGYFAALTLVIFILPPFAAYFQAALQHTFLFEWYLIYTLPAVVALLALGFDALALPFQRFRWSSVVPAVACLAFIIFYWNFTTPVRSWLLTKPLQPMRESVLLTRPTTQPNYPGYEKVLTASFNTPAWLYDPHMIRIRTLDEFISTLQEADKRGLPLYLNIGNPWAAATLHPQMFTLTMHSPLFEVTAQLPGMDPTLDRIVARYVPGSLNTFDIQAFLKTKP
ncbi:MAG: hypothetical protein ACK5NG_03945 [Chthoniobacterales bacterium]